MVNMTQHDVKNLRFTINSNHGSPIKSYMEIPLSPMEVLMSPVDVNTEVQKI